MLRPDPAGCDPGGVVAARAPRLHDALHDQLLVRADTIDRVAQEGQRGAQGPGDDAPEGRGQHPDPGRIATDVDAGTRPRGQSDALWTGQRDRTSSDGIPTVLIALIYFLFRFRSFFFHPRRAYYFIFIFLLSSETFLNLFYPVYVYNRKAEQ